MNADNYFRQYTSADNELYWNVFSCVTQLSESSVDVMTYRAEQRSGSPSQMDSRWMCTRMRERRRPANSIPLAPPKKNPTTTIKSGLSGEAELGCGSAEGLCQKTHRVVTRLFFSCPQKFHSPLAPSSYTWPGGPDDSRRTTRSQWKTHLKFFPLLRQATRWGPAPPDVGRRRSHSSEPEKGERIEWDTKVIINTSILIIVITLLLRTAADSLFHDISISRQWLPTFHTYTQQIQNSPFGTLSLQVEWIACLATAGEHSYFCREEMFRTNTSDRLCGNDPGGFHIL